MMPEKHWTAGPKPYKQANGEEWWPAEGNQNILLGALYARRSDGEIFMAAMSITKEVDPRPAVDEAMKRLGTFEKCECVVDVPCAQHKDLIGAIREGGLIPPPPKA